MRKISVGILLLLLAFPAAAQNWKAVLRYDKQQAKADLQTRLLRYAAQDTQADVASAQTPSSKGQLAFAKSLAKELKQIGASNVQLYKTGLITAEIPATTSQPAPVIALAAHVDTPSGIASKNIEPQVHAKYTSGDIVLDKEQNIRLTEANSPHLLQAHGHDIVTSSGNTLLGASDKNGLAILMTLADYLLGNTSISHGTIKLIFLPDGTLHKELDVLGLTDLKVDYVYTVDGSDMGEITTESFGQRNFTAVFEGQRDVPLGQAYGANFADNVLMASDFHTLLPRHRRPETTTDHRGYIYVTSIETQSNRTTVRGEVTAFTEPEITELSQSVTQAFKTVKAMFPKNQGAELSWKEAFQNMNTTKNTEAVRRLAKAMQEEEVHPKSVSKRHITDGELFAKQGIATAGVFAGMFNSPGLLEYADVDVMEASLRSLLTLVTTF